MKNYLHAIIVFGAIILTSIITVSAQDKISFKYDLSGNRTDRKVIELTQKNASIAQGDKQKELKDQLGIQEVRIYPNPTKGLLKIDFPDLSKTGAILSVHNLQGGMLIQKQAQEIGNELDLSAYPSGLYILVIQAGEERKEWKIVKE